MPSGKEQVRPSRDTKEQVRPSGSMKSRDTSANKEDQNLDIIIVFTVYM